MSCTSIIIQLSSTMLLEILSELLWPKRFQKIQQLQRIQASDVFRMFTLPIKQSVPACRRHKDSQNVNHGSISFHRSIHAGGSIQPGTQRTLFNSFSFHAAPYTNLGCSWNISWYAKYVLRVDWRNKWAGCKVDKNVGKWNREQHSTPRCMSLRTHIFALILTQTNPKQGTIPARLPILIFYHMIALHQRVVLVSL